MALDYSLHPGKAWHELVAAPLSEARERERAKKEARRKSLEATLERYQRAKSRFYETLVRGIVCICFVWGGVVWCDLGVGMHAPSSSRPPPLSPDQPTNRIYNLSLSFSLSFPRKPPGPARGDEAHDGEGGEAGGHGRAAGAADGAGGGRVGAAHDGQGGQGRDEGKLAVSVGSVSVSGQR